MNTMPVIIPVHSGGGHIDSKFLIAMFIVFNIIWLFNFIVLKFKVRKLWITEEETDDINGGMYLFIYNWIMLLAWIVVIIILLSYFIYKVIP